MAQLKLDHDEFHAGAAPTATDAFIDLLNGFNMELSRGYKASRILSRCKVKAGTLQEII